MSAARAAGGAAVQERGGAPGKLVEMIDHGLRCEAVERGGGIAEAHEDHGDGGGLRRPEIDLSPIITARDGLPPASAITPVRWRGSGLATAKVSRPAIALK